MLSTRLVEREGGVSECLRTRVCVCVGVGGAGGGIGRLVNTKLAELTEIIEHNLACVCIGAETRTYTTTSLAL